MIPQQHLRLSVDVVPHPHYEYPRAGKVDFVICNFGVEPCFAPWGEKVFTGFDQCDRVFQRPVNAKKAAVKKHAFTVGNRPEISGHCIYLMISPIKYALFQIAHPSWKQISAAFNRAKKEYRFKHIAFNAGAQRLIRTYLAVNRERRHPRENTAV